MEQTVRHGLPLLVQGQGQKDVTHNEALLALDALIHPALLGLQEPVPPAAPQPGDCWAVPDGAGADWAGHDGAIAMWTPAGWRFIDAIDGMSAWLVPEGRLLRRRGRAWQREAPVQRQEPDIAFPTGGSLVDAEARAAIVHLIEALRRLGLVGG